MTPEEFLEKYGLVRYSSYWLLPVNKTLFDEARGLVPVKKDLNKLLDKARESGRKMRDAEQALDDAKKQQETVIGNMHIVNSTPESRQRIANAEQGVQPARETAGRDRAAAEAAVSKAARRIKPLREDYDKAMRQYATLVDAPAIRKAVEDYNETAEKKLKLGPSSSFQALGRELAEIGDLIGPNESRIPYREQGKLKYIPVELQRQETIDMIVDSGAEKSSRCHGRLPRRRGSTPKRGSRQ